MSSHFILLLGYIYSTYYQSTTHSHYREDPNLNRTNLLSTVGTVEKIVYTHGTLAIYAPTPKSSHPYAIFLPLFFTKIYTYMYIFIYIDTRFTLSLYFTLHFTIFQRASPWHRVASRMEIFNLTLRPYRERNWRCLSPVLHSLPACTLSKTTSCSLLLYFFSFFFLFSLVLGERKRKKAFATFLYLRRLVNSKFSSTRCKRQQVKGMKR